MGNPPDPLKNCPYPGVSPTKFDPIGALSVYRDALKKERDVDRQDLENRVNANVRGQPVPVECKLGDLMPGLASITKTYKDLGYTFNAVGNATLERSAPPLRCNSELSLVAPTALSSSLGRVTLKPEGHSRLSLLDSWHESLKAGNSMANPAPNMRALWGNDHVRGEDEGSNLSVSCLSSQLSGSRVSGSHLSGSQLSIASRSGRSLVASSVPPSKLRPAPFSQAAAASLKTKRGGGQQTWSWDSRRGPRLSHPGCKPVLVLGDMTIEDRRPRPS